MTAPPASRGAARPAETVDALAVAVNLEATSRHRVIALAAVQALYPDASLHDALILARWVVAGAGALTPVGHLDLSEHRR